MTENRKYYAEGGARAKRVEDLFSKIAPRYDLINDLQSLGLHRLLKRRLVRLAAVPDQARALDLCCGTGDLVRALARTYPRASFIAGLDFAMPMLRIAAARAAIAGADAGSGVGADSGTGAAAGIGTGATAGAGSNAGAAPHARIAYFRADALRIPIGDAAFDRVTMSYGLRNVADIGACLAEARRVLRPGGRLVILDFSKPQNKVLASLYFTYLRRAVPLFGRIFFGDPETYGYILVSLQHFPSPEVLTRMLLAAGFARVRGERPLFGTMGIQIADV